MSMSTIVRTYSELKRLETYEERFDYLRLNGKIGQDTFGFDRIFNQIFYSRSKEWRKVRNEVIVRDNGCDLGVDGYEIHGKILIHHMNPITLNDILEFSDFLINPNYLICTSLLTHNAIHYGNKDLLLNVPKERTLNDTCPWKNRKEM